MEIGKAVTAALLKITKATKAARANILLGFLGLLLFKFHEGLSVPNPDPVKRVGRSGRIGVDKTRGAGLAGQIGSQRRKDRRAKTGGAFDEIADAHGARPAQDHVGAA